MPKTSYLWARMMIAATLILVLAAVSPEPAGAAGSAAALDGRLGGPLASFEKLYGAATAGDPGDGEDFQVPGIGVIFAQFQYAPDPNNPGRISTSVSPESPATVVTIHPNRAAASSASAPDPADWPVAEAQKRVKKVLPTDATLAKFEPAAGRASQTCASATLSKTFTSVAHAGCGINYVMPTKNTVSYVTIALSAGTVDASQSPTNPCSGAVEWSQATGRRLQQAQDVLDEVAKLSGSDAAAATKLDALSGQFGALADAQEKSASPPVMGVANDRVAGALRAYATAVKQAGDALAAQDSAAVDAAVANLSAANDAAARATAVIQRALADCGLQPGTPVAVG